MSKDYYNILGVGKTASKDEIKKAFREKAHLFHPDKPGGDEKKFKEVNEAYQVLNNEQKRQQYDQYGATFDQQGGFGQGMNWDDFMRSARQGGGTSYSNVNFDMGDLGDIFEGLFGGGFGYGQSGRGRKTTARGRDIEVSLSLSFTEAVFGVTKTIELTKLVTCDHCHGNGAEPGSKISDCQACNGKGQVHKVQRTILGHIQTVVNCSACQGEGKTYEKPCNQCQGQGRVKTKVQIPIKIPAGINNGITLKLSGDGEAGVKGGKAGDLYLHVQVQSDKYFQRDGDNILTKLAISFSQAALGDKVKVQTIDGNVNLKIPAGIQSGKILILKGQGVPHFQHYGRGDHLVEIIVQTPENLTRDQKNTLEELKKYGL